MSAKELCAMLITRSLKDLTEDEEEIVVDYLEDMGISVDLDAKPRDLCVSLLEKTMEKELGKRVPISAYANSLISKKQVEKEEKAKQQKKKEIQERRAKEQRVLEQKSLPGCVASDFLSKNLFKLQVDPSVGIMDLSDGTSQYSAVISLSEDLYTSIFTNFSNPIIEIISSKGKKGYARLAEPHGEDSNTVYISPLVAFLLDVGQKDGAFLKLCSSIPDIAQAKFTFYGSRKELDEILPLLIEKLPSVINAFSYLFLGMLLMTNINGKEVYVRVDGLTDFDERPIFAGLIPFAEGDLPFEIEPDLN